MEKNEKVEKPGWVELVDGLPEASRQYVGNLCANIIQSCSIIALISGDLLDAIKDFVYKSI